MHSQEEASNPESLLASAIASGTVVDSRVGNSGRDDPANGATWGAERTIRAQAVIELLSSHTLPSGQRPRALRIAGVRITGKLALEAMTIVCPLTFEHCFFDQPLLLDEASAPRVALTQCRLPALSARQLRTRGDFMLDGSTATGGEVSLVRAHIGGVVDFSGSQLTNPDGPALNADTLRVEQHMLCREGFTAEGEVRLLGAHIGGQLNLSGAQLTNPDGPALNADRLRVDRGMFCAEGFTSEGEVSLVGAHIGGVLNLFGARLTNIDGRVAIAKQRRRRDGLGGRAKALSYALDAAVGYGYRTWRAVYALVAIVVIGWGVFAWASWNHLREMRPDGQRPPYQPWLYSIDAVLPVINFGQETAWAPTGAAQVWYAFSVLAGWLLSLGLIAVLTATLFRE